MEGINSQMKTGLKIALIVVVVLILALAGGIWYVVSQMQKDAVEIVAKPTVSPNESGTTEIVVLDEMPSSEPETTAEPIYQEEQKSLGIVNVLLIGTDNRTKASVDQAVGNADTVILASYDRDKNTIALLSFMRDSWLKIQGEKSTYMGKLNSAYSSGGIGRLVNTINLNYDLDVQNYVAIGFDGFSALIDEIGGIEIDVDARERNVINARIDKEGRTCGYVQGTGMQLLNGEQALLYARNRTSGLEEGEGGNDFARVSRQQEVIQVVYKTVLNKMNVSNIAGLISLVTQHVSTNMDVTTMVELGTALMNTQANFSTEHVPFEGEWGYSDNGSAIEFNIDKAAEKVHALLYGAGTQEAETPAN